jgi:stage IV sporulation protein FB
MLRLGSIGRTSIDIDFSFFMLITFFVVMSYDPRAGIQYALLWVPVLFISVLVHELAHAGMIAALGFGYSHVILGGMGGVTINDRRARPWQDFLISAAGPASSFGLAFLCSTVAGTVPIRDLFLANLVRYLISANFFWGIFNSIPVPPLDGGHAVRHLLRMFLTERTAFIIAVWIAIVGGAAVAIWAAFGGQFFIALFVAWFAYQNYQSWQYFRDHGIPGD